MDPTAQFFSKLKKLARSLETETARLQVAYQSRREAGSPEKSDRAMRALYDMSSEVGDLKVQLQDQLARQRAKEDEMSCFIKACVVMEQRLTDDIQRLRGHWQKYGYQPPEEPHPAAEVKGDEGAEEEEEAEVAGGDEGRQEGEAGADLPLDSPTTVGPPPSADPMRTPQLSDFGLSELHLKRLLGGAALISEAPPTPEMSLPLPATPPMPVTPKCVLRMDEDDELQTPKLLDFGISEHTMCFNNDFTMDLHRKNAEKIQRPAPSLSLAPGNSGMESWQTRDSLETPEPPVLCSSGFNITKSNTRFSPPPPGGDDPQSPVHPAALPTSPEVPAFETPYVKRLFSTRKGGEPEPAQTQDENLTFDLASPCNPAADSQQTRDHEPSLRGVEVMEMPEMPSLESDFGLSLQNSAGVTKKLGEGEAEAMEPCVPGEELDGPTQEFRLRTPRVRRCYQEASTPEMPELSSVTQDICKLLSQTQLKKAAVAVVQPRARPEDKENRAQSLPVVSQSEFHSLPRYLRLMTLSSLNQAVHKINHAVADKSHGEEVEFQTDELKQITGLGTKAPIYFLCLTELQRLELVGGVGVSSVYKVASHN
ncbi:spindle and kinetochore-associated protein 3-like isoform X2 [Myripristis murdjan]|uniref:spindle and kinetochore-associated protein 3-like isoform X2 n=1 Tax=Myripristis murdjan TaxID=586833 RepID=UPI001175CCA7|nr:spindle and kinetochore-associated protein 3-like isoform X2 [Myripristis murdjan]